MTFIKGYLFCLIYLNATAEVRQVDLTPEQLGQLLRQQHADLQLRQRQRRQQLLLQLQLEREAAGVEEEDGYAEGIPPLPALQSPPPPTDRTPLGEPLAAWYGGKKTKKKRKVKKPKFTKKKGKKQNKKNTRIKRQKKSKSKGKKTKRNYCNY